MMLMAKREFQSTPPCGGDPRRKDAEAALRISIHAPLRGRPQPFCCDLHRILFQSTPPCGGDGNRPGIACYRSGFQSTPPCGGDLGWPAMIWPIMDFNPRPLAGATTLSKDKIYHERNFNPRPLAGATKSKVLYFPRDVFQSTPPCGGDCCRLHPSVRDAISIHAPLRGRRLHQRHGDNRQGISIHAPLRGRPPYLLTAGF